LSSALNIDSSQRVLGLLDDEIDDAAFKTAIDELDASPALMEALMTAQLVKDALKGTVCLDRKYTAGIMQFIANAEAQAKAKDDPVE
jgi:hypothetical protein